MTREEFLKSKILEQMTMKDFAAKIHMPYTTLMSILKNVGGASFDNMTKICKGLHVPIESLAHFEEIKILPMEPSIDEYAKYARMNPNLRVLFNLVKNMPEEQTKEIIHYIEFIKTRV